MAGSGKITFRFWASSPCSPTSCHTFILARKIPRLWTLRLSCQPTKSQFSFFWLAFLSLTFPVAYVSPVFEGVSIYFYLLEPKCSHNTQRGFQTWLYRLKTTTCHLSCFRPPYAIQVKALFISPQKTENHRKRKKNVFRFKGGHENESRCYCKFLFPHNEVIPLWVPSVEYTSNTRHS